jgi:ElaB/YqjD/DUF883 family membrane-anchored ribosome-binding protein
MNTPLPANILESRAAHQRSQIQNTVSEFRRNVRDRLDVKRNVRDHVWPAAGAAALLGMVLGYVVAGAFTRD